MLYGSGKLTYELVEDWAKVPEGFKLGPVTSIATDSSDMVYALNRSEHPVVVFDRNGKFQGTWGEGAFGRPHSISISPKDEVWCTDDKDHVCLKFTLDGKLQQTLGTRGRPSDSGVIPQADLDATLDTIKRAAPPFNRPTKVSVVPSGNIYITDGYANAAVHHFSSDGRLLATYGAPGRGEGQFRCPHGVQQDKRGNIWVADRQNYRVQLFDNNFKYLRQITGLGRTADIFINKEDYVFCSELDGFVTAWDLDGNQVVRFGATDSPLICHSIWEDSRGDLYAGFLGHGSLMGKLVRKG